MAGGRGEAVRNHKDGEHKEDQRDVEVGRMMRMRIVKMAGCSATIAKSEFLHPLGRCFDTCS